MKLNKFFKWCLVALLVISVAILVWGFTVGFENNSGQAVDILFYWAYIVLGIAVAGWVLIGGIIAAKNNPKFLVKMGLALVAVAAVCFVAYMLAQGNYAIGREGLDEQSVLKLTDTILNLTYFAGGAAILSIVVGELRLAITNRK